MIKDIIRIADLDDLDDIFELANKAFGTSPWPKEHFLNLINSARGNIKVSVFQEKIVAFLCYTSILDEQHIDLIATDPSLQGKGLAQKLLHSIESETIARLLLEVDDQNIKAIKLYEKLNYTEYYRRKNYYSNGNDAILMEKKL